MLGPAQKSTKRKLEEVERDDGAYVDPRQSILSISMCKLKTCPVRRVEPSLRRSVLIFNTLKILEHELQKEGLPVTTCDTGISLPVMDTDDVTLDILPDVGHISPSNSLEQRGIFVNSMFKEDEAKCPNLDPMPSPQTETPTYTSLCSSTYNQPMEISLGLNELTDSLARQTVTDILTSAQTFMPSPFSSISSVPLRMEELRTDLDMPLCDLDTLSPFSHNSKLPPLSAEEIMHSFSSHNNGLPDSFSTISSPQCCKSDVIGEDFDHIMQILVGM